MAVEIAAYRQKREPRWRAGSAERLRAAALASVHSRVSAFASSQRACSQPAQALDEKFSRDRLLAHRGPPTVL